MFRGRGTVILWGLKHIVPFIVAIYVTIEILPIWFDLGSWDLGIMIVLFLILSFVQDFIVSIIQAK